jgi:hypothetical protein
MSMKYVKGQGWGWVDPKTGELVFRTEAEKDALKEAARKRTEQAYADHSYYANKDYSDKYNSLYDMANNGTGGPSFGSWTNHLHHRLDKAKQDGFWDKYGEKGSGIGGYSFMGFNEMSQGNGMGHEIWDRNNVMFDMLRNGWGWDQVYDIAYGKLDPKDAKANYSDFYKDIGYDPNSGGSVEEALASAPQWAREFYKFDPATGAYGAGNTGGGMFGGITPGPRKERTGVWGAGHNERRPNPNHAPKPASPSIPVPTSDAFPTQATNNSPLEDKLWPADGMMSPDSEGMRKTIVNALEKKLLG